MKRDCSFSLQQIGRRVVDVSLLMNKLSSGCVRCNTPLDGRRVVKERVYGMASLLSIDCVKCGKVNTVTTGKQHSEFGQRGIGPFDVNKKAALGKPNVVKSLSFSELL